MPKITREQKETVLNFIIRDIEGKKLADWLESMEVMLKGFFETSMPGIFPG